MDLERGDGFVRVIYGITVITPAPIADVVTIHLEALIFIALGDYWIAESCPEGIIELSIRVCWLWWVLHV